MPKTKEIFVFAGSAIDGDQSSHHFIFYVYTIHIDMRDTVYYN